MGSCPTPGNELSRETHELTKQKILLERCLAEPRRTALPPWLAVLGFTLIGLVSRLSLPNQSDSPSWWHMHCSAKMDGGEKDSGRRSDMWCLLLTFPELFWLVVAY